MDKNTLTGVMLMAAIVFGFMYCNRPDPEAQQRQKEEQIAQARQDSVRRAEEARNALIIPEITEADVTALQNGLQQYGRVEADGSRSISTEAYDLRLVGDSLVQGVIKTGGYTIDVNDVIAGQYPEEMQQRQKADAGRTVVGAISDMAQYRGLTAHLGGSEELIELKNDVLALQLSTRGGQISHVELLDPKYKWYVKSDSTQVSLWDATSNSYGFTLAAEGIVYDTRNLNFTPVCNEDTTSVLMKLDMGNGAWWGIRYTMPDGDSYYVKMDVEQHNMAATDIISPTLSYMGFNWEQRMARFERGRAMEERNSAIYYKEDGDDVENLSEAKSDDKTVKVPVKWIGFKNQFFSSIIIADDVFNSRAELESKELKSDPDFLKVMRAEAQVDYDVNKDNVASFTFYLGPNLYPVLRDMDDVVGEKGLDLTRVIPLGWTLFRWINTGFIIPVFTFLSKYIANYGIIILILTILIKIILFPFTYKTYRSQAKMRLLQPEIQAINEQYPGKENAMVRQQKTMALYSRAGVNPMGGCLPMLLQMPILIAMFSFFPSCIELRGQAFLWAKDLAAPDAIITWNANIPLISWLFDNHISLFCLLMTVTNIIYSKTMMQSQAGGASMPGMKLMTYGMPLMFLFWFNNYAAGLSYYYFLSLLITIIQTYVIRHWVIDEAKVRAEMEANARKPRKKSGLMARLEEAQRKQQQAMREQAQARGNKNRRR